MFKRFFLVLITLTSPLFSADKDEFLVCLHGFMGGAWNMRSIEKNLKKEGWDVINWQYPSRDAFIAEHGEHLVQTLRTLSAKRPGKPICFVVHSMGSLVLLAALNHPLCPVEAKIGKVVLIAPSLKGSSLCRWLSRFSLARGFAKDFSGHELMTKTNFDDLGNFPDSLEDILVIAGSWGLNPLLEGTNDGAITLNETSLSIPHKRVVIKCGHLTILFNKKVCKIICGFLRDDLRIPQT